jgi:hypothetical protein
MARKHKDTVSRLAALAIGLGAEGLDIEYKDGHEEVFAIKNGLGWGIASLRSSSRDAKLLRAELFRMAKRKRQVILDEMKYELRTRIYDSFGEHAFRVKLRRV